MSSSNPEGFNPEPVSLEVKKRVGWGVGVVGIGSGATAAYELLSGNETAALSLGAAATFALGFATRLLRDSRNSPEEPEEKPQNPPDNLE